MSKNDIISKLSDLHDQATKERSHYYVASVVREAITEILKLRQSVNSAKTIDKLLEEIENR